MALGSITFFIIGIQESIWREIGMAAFVWRTFIEVITLIIFFSLIMLIINKRPFSKNLTWSIRIIGILFAIAAFVIPRLQGYESSGIEIFASGSFVLIDGAILIPGLLLIILGNIIMAGFDMQKEIDEIL